MFLFYAAFDQLAGNRPFATGTGKVLPISASRTPLSAIGVFHTDFSLYIQNDMGSSIRHVTETSPQASTLPDRVIRWMRCPQTGRSRASVMGISSMDTENTEAS